MHDSVSGIYAPSANSESDWLSTLERPVVAQALARSQGLLAKAISAPECDRHVAIPAASFTILNQANGCAVVRRVAIGMVGSVGNEETRVVLTALHKIGFHQDRNLRWRSSLSAAPCSKGAAEDEQVSAQVHSRLTAKRPPKRRVRRKRLSCVTLVGRPVHGIEQSSARFFWQRQRRRARAGEVAIFIQAGVKGPPKGKKGCFLRK